MGGTRDAPGMRPTEEARQRGGGERKETLKAKVTTADSIRDQILSNSTRSLLASQDPLIPPPKKVHFQSPA